MKPLIDGDILCYEIGFGCQKKVDGEIVPIPIAQVNERIDRKIKDICAEVWATEEPTIFFTGKNNFRKGVAVSKAYKGSRKEDRKPHYWKYIRNYLKAKYDCEEHDLLEADDLLAIRQMERLDAKDTIICSRDKDLLMVRGYHYSWECGKQPSFGPEWVDELGRYYQQSNKDKWRATGLRLFYLQMLMGDGVDNIGGIYAIGPERAHELLENCTTKEEMHQVVIDTYKECYHEDWLTKIKETADLVWMVLELEGNKFTTGGELFNAT